MLEYSRNSSLSHYKPLNYTNLTSQINYHYSKFLKTISLPSSTSHSQDSNLPKPEKIALKYFGNKLFYSIQLKARNSHSKNYCKYLKKFKNPLTYENKLFSNPLEQLCRFGRNSISEACSPTFCKVITACKYLHSLELAQDGVIVSLQNIKKLRMLQSLVISLKEDQILKNKSAIQSLISLQRISLTIYRQDSSKLKSLVENSQLSFIQKFYRQLLELPDLKVLNLQLQDSNSCKYPIIVEELLERLGESKLYKYNIQTRLNKSDAINIQKIEKTLAQIDFLIFRVVNTNSKFIIFDGSHLVLPGTTYTEEIESFTEKSNKVLDIYYKDIAMLDLGSIINRCNELKSLGLHFGHTDAFLTLPNDLAFLKNLNNVIFSFEGLGGGRIANILSNLANMLKITRTIEAISLLFIFSKLKEEAIDSLRLFHQVMKLNQIKRYTFQFRDKFKFKRGGKHEEVLETVSKQIAEITTIEELKIEAFVQGVVSLLETKSMLISLKSMKRLHFSIKSDLESDPYPVCFFFPFEALSQLKELRLRLKFPLLRECQLDIIENIKKLNNLEVLEIMEGTLLNISISLFGGMLKELSKMPKLKELIINARIGDDDCDIMSHRDNSKVMSKDLTCKLKEEIEKLFYGNKRLKKVHIYHSKCYSLKYTR